MGSFSIWHLLVLLLVVVLIFGTKRLTGGAKDLGNAVKEFKKAVRDEDAAKPADAKAADPNHAAIDPAKPSSADDQTPRG
jgi:sec-independent protein translocase protein TatA